MNPAPQASFRHRGANVRWKPNPGNPIPPMADGGPQDPAIAAATPVISAAAPAIAAADPVISDASPSSLLDTLGEEIVRIITPVSACMALVVLLVTALSSSSASPPSISTIFFSSDDSSDDSIWDKLSATLLSSLAFVVAVTAMTFILVFLFYVRCTRFLKYYMAFSSLIVLAFLGGDVSLLLLDRFSVPLDAPTFLILLLNFAVLGVVAVFSSKAPIVVTQGYLVVIGVLTAFWFTLLPEWTTWALLIAMALYDLAAVLLPCGPLRLLVELAISRDEEIPALVYEARPVEHMTGAETRVWRERRDVGANPVAPATEPPLPETRLVIEGPREPLLVRQPGRARRDEEDGDVIGLGSSGAIKLGLGDFIFYSVLVGRAAMYSFMAVYACYLAIIAGLGVTLLLLAFYQKALPALPVSVMLGVLFYVLTRFLLEDFIVQCSANLVMF